MLKAETIKPVLLQEGRYVDLYELPNRQLRMRLKEGLESDYREDVLAEYMKHGERYAFEILFDDFACNGWRIYEPEELGALTENIMFGNEYEYANEYSEELKSVGKVYYTDEIRTPGFLQILLDRGYYDFKFVIEE